FFNKIDFLYAYKHGFDKFLLIQATLRAKNQIHAFQYFGYSLNLIYLSNINHTQIIKNKFR
ncbi:TPA: hypothetical protein ACT9MT_002831, partial [Legionella pneumophila]